MKTIMNYTLILLLGISAGCSKENSQSIRDYKLKLSFEPTANGQSLQTNTQYLNAFGEDFKVSKFKFYITHISLRKTGSNNYVDEADSYHLVDGLDATGKSFVISLKQKEFDQIRLMIGVDSARNVSGAQTGALDPANGMFWTWNSGYIMAKLEGSSSYSTAPDQVFVYHIGGYREDEKTQRIVTLDFPSGSGLVMDYNKTPELRINVNIDKWFNGVHPLTIADNPAWMTPGGLATKYADNYATLFSVTAIVNQ